MNTLKKSLNVRFVIGLLFISAIVIGSKTHAQNTLDKVGLSNSVPATGAYSLRLLSSAYKGPLVRITIGTNYYDVYPDASSSSIFSTSSPISAAYTTYNATTTGTTSSLLKSIIGSNTASVAIWYDQSGNGNNVIQAITPNQPKIVNAGVINISNGLPSLLFNGALSYPSYMQATSVGYSSTTPHILNCVAAANTGVAVALSSTMGSYYNSVLGAGDPYQGAGDIWYGGYNQDGTNWTSGTSTTNLAVRSKKYTPSTTTINGYYNGTVIASNSASTSATYNLTGNDILIGMQDFQPYAVLNGSLSEVFVFASTVADASRQAFESNQGNYYGVTVSDAQPIAPTINSFTVAAQCSSASSFTLTAPTSNSQGAFTYTSSNTSVATISGSTVKIVGGGTSTITATQAASGNYTSGSATATLTVYSPTVLDSIVGISSICVGGTIQLSNSNTGGTWSSSNNYIGPINTSGLFIANAPGTATITYTYTNPGGCVSSKTKVITVNNVPYTGPLLGSSTVCTGNNDTLVAAGSGIWTTSNPTIATNVNGIITGVAAGVDTVIYTLTNSYGCITVTTAPITVLSNPIHLDTIVGNSIVCVGSTIQLSNSTPGGLWSSFDQYVATISATGLVTGNAYGTSTITYYVSNSNGCHSSVTTVVSTVNDPYTGPIIGSNIVCTSNNDTLRAAGSGNWTSSNTSIATINNGIVTGLTAGTDTIIYVLTNSYGCVTTTTAPIKVLSNPILLDTIVGPSNVCVGSTIQLTNSIPGGTWSSFSNYAGTITQTGVVTGNNYGNTTITYYVSNSNGCYAKTTKVISTQNLPYAGTITGSGSLCNGNTITLKPTVSNGAWSSTNNNITTVNSTGVVTGISGGTDSIVYKITNSYGCVSTLYKSITDASTSSLTTASICSGSSYLFNGTSYNTSGTYTAHLTNAAGCDSAATLKLTVSNKTTSTTTASICSGGSYTFNGTTYSTSGSYTIHLTNSVGCDSAATLFLTIKSLSTSTTNASICSGSSYTFNGNTYNTAGSYTVHLTNSIGCDSAATLVLTVKSLSTSTTTASICSGGSYTFNGTTYTIAGSYTVHLTNSIGCDSAATLVLTVKSLSTSTTSASICSGSSYTFNGTAYTTTGSYTIHLTNSVGCDSSATLVLTVKSLSTSTTTASICSGGSYSFNETAYTTAGSYTVHLTNSVGCDSAATLVLTVKSLSTSTTTASICNGGSYTFNGTSYNTAGTYVAHLTNSVGCDSAATLLLTVKSPSTSTTIASICSGNSYTFNGSAYTTAGSYTVHLTNSDGCDSAATLILTVNPLPSYATINGKDSLCAGSVDSFSASISGGVWGVSTPSVATIDSVGNVSAIVSGKDTISYTLTNTCGTATATKVIYIGTTIPSVQLIAGTSTACPGFTSTLTDATLDGYWTSADTSIATVDSTSGIVTGVTTGNANIIYTAVSAYGCTNSTSVPFTVNCGSVTSAGDGGLESKSMGEAVANRVYNRALANTVNTVDYNTLPIVKYTKKQFGIMGIGTPGSQELTDLMPSADAIGTGYDAYDMSQGVADLSGITNASVAKAYDYVADNSTKSATLITRTYGLVYQHTKPICDRLKEATLLDVRTVTVQGMDFIQYKLLQNTGQVEYAISFSASIQNNVDSFRIQSVWLTKNFINQDTMYNFQIWAIDPMMARSMLNNALNKLSSILPLSQINKQGVPSTYITNITRNQNKLVLNINNNTSATSASLNLSVTSNETTSSPTPQTIPVTLLPNGMTQVEVDLQDNFESDVNLFVEGNQTDLAYMNDGNWNYSLSNSSIQPNNFTVTNDGIMPDSGELRLFRTVNINVNVPDYVSVYKMMKAGGLSRDLTGYSNLLFTASATGAGTLKITIQKNSISNWNNQYSYTIPISANTTCYGVRLHDFKSAGSTDTLTANDVVTVTFSFIGDGSGNINATIFNAKFTQKDYVYIDSLTDKTVSAYPNPTNGRFNCVFKSNVDTKLTLKIVQLGTGRVVYTQNIDAVTGQNTVPISTAGSSIAEGYYILELENALGNYIPYKMLFRK